jgi:hypothetical protein
MDLNCLRIIDCITGTNKRSKFLRSQLALQLLKMDFGLKVSLRTLKRYVLPCAPMVLCSDCLASVLVGGKC